MATEPVAPEPTVPSLVDRYFTRWYKADVKGKPCEDHCILQHSNRICVITLAEAHPVLQSGKAIKSISYQISTNCSRLQNKVSGKFKRACNPLMMWPVLLDFSSLRKYMDLEKRGPFLKDKVYRSQVKPLVLEKVL